MYVNVLAYGEHVLEIQIYLELHSFELVEGDDKEETSVKVIIFSLSDLSND